MYTKFSKYPLPIFQIIPIWGFKFSNTLALRILNNFSSKTRKILKTFSEIRNNSSLSKASLKKGSNCQLKPQTSNASSNLGDFNLVQYWDLFCSGFTGTTLQFPTQNIPYCIFQILLLLDLSTMLITFPL